MAVARVPARESEIFLNRHVEKEMGPFYFQREGLEIEASLTAMKKTRKLFWPERNSNLVKVKIKLSLCFILNAYWGSGGIAPRIL
jgi:hypothetical protein